MTAPSSPLTRWTWVLIVVCLLAEFLLFDRMTSRHHTGIYPRWNDQIQYLTESYTAYQRAETDGLLAGVKQTLTKTALQGTLHDLAALFVFQVAGSPSRSAALSLNLLVFAAWQAMLFYTVVRRTGSLPLGWMAFGLLLCVAWPWSNQAGSAVDFRLDHAAMCLLGITACCALLSDGFRSLRWSLGFGLAVGVTLLERFLTGIYFAGLFLACAGWLLCFPDRWLRLRNLVLAGGVAAALSLPVFWHNREAIYTYYWVGHVTGAESVARFRGLDLLASSRFVFGHLGQMHLGVFFGGTAVAVSALLALFLALGPRRQPSTSRRDWIFLGVVYLLVPAAILTLHKQKSEYVLGVLVPGVMLLVLALWASLWARTEFNAGPRWRKWLPLLAAIGTLGAGGGYFVHRQLTPAHDVHFLTEARRINAIADRIFDTARAQGLTNPYIAVDQVVDFLDAQILQVICFERKKVWVPFVIQLPNSILEDKDEVMMYRLKLCDFVVLTDQMHGDGYWPYDKQMRRLYPEMKAWCEENLVRAETFEAFGRRMTLYHRRPKT